jgi:hypothetical protein
MGGVTVGSFKIISMTLWGYFQWDSCCLYFTNNPKKLKIFAKGTMSFGWRHATKKGMSFSMQSG